MSDATLVTGASGGRAPRKGDVLAERYEILEVLAAESLVVSYRALDQESDAPVLVRCTAPGLLGEREARGMVERLRPLVGGGGRVVSPLRDVDREGAVVLTVEPWPRGASLRSMLDARRAEGAGTLEPREVLPIVAHLATAIASIPEPYWHGDLRAERIYVDGGAVVLTGGFLLSMLAGDLVSSALEDEPAVAHGLAPELGEGLGGRASDRWGVAALVWEALTGSAPGEGRPVPPPALGAAGVELARVLDGDPAARPPTLDALVAAIAALARLPVPHVDRDAFPEIERTSPDPGETTQVAELDAPPTDPARRGSTIPAPPSVAPSVPPPVPVLGDPPTVRTSPREGGSSNDTAPHAALDRDGKPHAPDLDPDLVRAALAPDDDPLASGELELVESRTEPGAKVAVIAPPRDELDPRLVRAALGVTEGAPAPPAPPQKRSSAVTQELGPGDLEELRATVSDAAKARLSGSKSHGLAAPGALAQPAAPPATKAARKRPVREPEPVPLPADIKPIPRPRVDDGDELPAGPVLFDASRAAAPAPIAAAAAPAPLPAIHEPAAGPPAHASARRVPAWASWAIVAAAVFLAVVIVGAGFWYRSSLQREAERQQLIEQRLREIQSTTP